LGFRKIGERLCFCLARELDSFHTFGMWSEGTYAPSENTNLPSIFALGTMFMLLLIAAVPVLAWFLLFSIPLGLLSFAVLRTYRYYAVDRRPRLIWSHGYPRLYRALLH
jgi:hypothetical protein